MEVTQALGKPRDGQGSIPIFERRSRKHNVSKIFISIYFQKKTFQKKISILFVKLMLMVLFKLELVPLSR